MKSKYLLQKEMKSKGVAYLCLVFGLHYFYLGQIGKGILFWLTMGGFMLWWFYDLVTLSSRIDKHNEAISDKLEHIDEINGIKAQLQTNQATM